MPFEIGKAINSMADTIISAPMVETIAKNPIYTALIVTFVIILIIIFIFRDINSDEPLLALSLRSGFYIFLFMTITLLIHNKALMNETSGAMKGSEVAGVFKATGSYSSDSMQINPTEELTVPMHINYDMNNI